MEDSVGPEAVQEALVVAQREPVTLVQFDADATARKDVVAEIALFIGVLVEPVDAVAPRLFHGADAHRRNNAAEEEQFGVAADGNVELRADGKVHVHFVQTGALREIILLTIGAKVDTGAVAEDVREALGILEIHLDAIGVIDLLTLLEIEPGGRAGAETDLCRRIRTRQHQSRGGEDEQESLFHGYRVMWLSRVVSICPRPNTWNSGS